VAQVLASIADDAQPVSGGVEVNAERASLQCGCRLRHLGRTCIGTGGSALRCSLNAALLREDAVGVIVSDPAGTTLMHADLV
jgi:hypothetical protein